MIVTISCPMIMSLQDYCYYVFHYLLVLLVFIIILIYILLFIFMESQYFPVNLYLHVVILLFFYN